MLAEVRVLEIKRREGLAERPYNQETFSGVRPCDHPRHAEERIGWGLQLVVLGRRRSVEGELTGNNSRVDSKRSNASQDAGPSSLLVFEFCMSRYSSKLVIVHTAVNHGK